MSTGYSEIFSRLSPLDWCSYLQGDPRGLLGAPAVAALCGIKSHPGGEPVTLAWGSASLEVGGGGLRALLGGPPRLDVRPPVTPRPRGSGGSWISNMLLHRRILPARAASTFPGCLEAPDSTNTGLLRLEPLEAARAPKACVKREWRRDDPPRLGPAVIDEQGLRCSWALDARGSKLVICGGDERYLVASDGGALLVGDGLALRTGCADYVLSALHPGGPVTVYAWGHSEVEGVAFTIACSEGELFAASPWGLRLRLAPGSIRLETLGGPIALGPGGPLKAARSIFEAWMPADYRLAEGELGHARCANCAGSAVYDPVGRELWLYAWTPTGEAGILEVRLRKPSEARALVIDAHGESWVPIERGLFRVPLPPGWHALVSVKLREGEGLADLLRDRLRDRLGRRGEAG